MIISGTAASAHGRRNKNREIRLICFCFQTKRRERRRTPTGDDGMMSVGKESGRRPGRGGKGAGKLNSRTRLQILCVCTSRTCRSSWTIPLRLYPACSGFPFLIRGLWVISLKEGESLFSSLSFQIKSSLVSQTELSVNTDKTRNGSGRGTQKGLCLLRSSTA